MLQRFRLRRDVGANSGYYSHQPNPLGLTSRVAHRARKGMFDTFLRLARPGPDTTVLDVGVTANQRPESNFFEKLYPHAERITAVGLEDASFLETDHPGLRFVKTVGDHLPFADNSFDLAVSFAVVEHVGTRDDQRRFVAEMCRVARRVLITTPNRWYPIEFHTLSPLVHWLSPQTFRKYLRTIGQEFYAEERNLNLLTADELGAMFPPSMQVTAAHHRLLGLVSNLVFYAER
jgi:hypothetical protein